MKILHLIDIPWWSGLSVYAMDSVLAHQKSGHNVTVLCSKNSLFHKKSKEFNIKTFNIYKRKNIGLAINFLKIGKFILKNSPNIIIAHTGSTHWIAIFWGLLMNIPIIRVRANAQKIKKTFLNLIIHHLTKQIITASKNLEENYISWIGEKLTPKIKTIYPPCEAMNTTDIQEQKNLIKIGLLARLDPVKGHYFFIQAAKLIQKKIPKIEFHFVGPEENISWCEFNKKIKELNIKNIYYHGFLTSSEVQLWIQKMDIGIISSLNSEEVARALMEWMSYSKPVIATQVGCISEILIDSKGGYIVQPKNIDLLANKLIELIENVGKRIKMGKFNYERILTDFSKTKFQELWENALK